MSPIEIEAARLGDEERIARLLTFVQQLHADAMPYWFKQPAGPLFALDLVREELNDPDVTFFIARRDGRDMGYAQIKEYTRPDNPFGPEHHHLSLNQIGVHPDFRRQGFARALLARVREEAQARQVSGIQLSIWDFNEVSRAFFQSEGFVPMQTRYFLEVK